MITITQPSPSAERRLCSDCSLNAFRYVKRVAGRLLFDDEQEPRVAIYHGIPDGRGMAFCDLGYITQAQAGTAWGRNHGGGERLWIGQRADLTHRQALVGAVQEASGTHRCGLTYGTEDLIQRQTLAVQPRRIDQHL